jgi:hypothetical protein
MTLNTVVWLIKPELDRDKLWADVLAMVAGPRAATASVTDEQDRYSDDSRERTRMTTPGQGLPAWTFMHYLDDGSQFDATPRTEDENARPMHYIRLNFDTSYGYESPIGDCSALHASYLMKLADLGYEFLWKNEYTGDIYYSTTGIDTLLKSGEDAGEWFQNTVLPFFEAWAAKGAQN